jgi:hypothetical protein
MCTALLHSGADLVRSTVTLVTAALTLSGNAEASVADAWVS